MGWDLALKYHGKIIDAIMAKDEKGAVEVMREHLENNVKYIEEIKSETKAFQTTN